MANIFSGVKEGRGANRRICLWSERRKWHDQMLSY